MFGEDTKSDADLLKKIMIKSNREIFDRMVVENGNDQLNITIALYVATYFDGRNKDSKAFKRKHYENTYFKQFREAWDDHRHRRIANAKSDEAILKITESYDEFVESCKS